MWKRPSNFAWFQHYILSAKEGGNGISGASRIANSTLVHYFMVHCGTSIFYDSFVCGYKESTVTRHQPLRTGASYVCGMRASLPEDNLLNFEYGIFETVRGYNMNMNPHRGNFLSEIIDTDMISTEAVSDVFTSVACIDKRSGKAIPIPQDLRNSFNKILK